MGASQDAAVYVLAGVRLRQGLMPYRDLFDNKPPGSYLVNAFGQAILPWLDPWRVAWLLSVGSCAGSALVLYALLRRSVGPWSAWSWSLVGCAGAAGYLTALGGGLTETFALAPLSLALWLVGTEPRNAKRSLGVGALLGVACLISLECMPAAAAIGFGWALDRGSTRGDILNRVLLVGAAGSAIVLAAGAWLVATSAAGAAIDQLLLYNAAYRATGAGPISELPLAVVFLGGLAIPVFMELRSMARDPSGSDRLSWISVAWIVGYAAYLAYQGRLFPHYLILAVPPVVLLSARGVEPLRVALATRNAAQSQVALGAVAVSVFALSVFCSLEVGSMALAHQSSLGGASDQTAAWIKANEPAGSSLFVWGYDPNLYLNGGAVPSEGYVFIYPLITPGFGSEARTAALLDAWRSHPPDMIVEVDCTVPLNRPDSTGGDTRTYDTLEPVRGFVRAHYRLAVSFGSGSAFDDIYVLVGSS